MVAATFFEAKLQLRPSAEQLLRAALGRPVELPPLPSTPTEVEADVRFDGMVWHAGVLHDLIVRLAVPEGQHRYGEPVPEGMAATSVEVDPAVGLVVKPPVMPPTRPHTLAGTGETLQVFEGEVRIRVPVTQLGRSLIERDDGVSVQPLTGRIRWQACDDDTCHLPRTQELSLEIPATGQRQPADELADPNGMDVATHLPAMVARRTTKPLRQILHEMSAPDET